MEFIKKLILTLSFTLSLGIVCLMIMIIDDRDISGAKQTRIVLVLLLFLITSVLIGICIRAVTKLYRYEAQYQILQVQLEQEQNMYTKVNDVYEQARMMNHDLKHYLSAVLGLLENEEYDEAKRQIIELIGSRLEMNMVQYASSSAINAVLNDKLVRAKKECAQLDIKVSGTLPVEYEMKLAIIIANLLDNAIEAVSGSANAKVELDMYEMKGMYYVSVRNAITQSVLKDNPKLETTKKEKEKHGVGINSVRYLAKELDGNFQIKEENGYFLSYLSFPIVKT